jgi:hypothetical protein
MFCLCAIIHDYPIGLRRDQRPLLHSSLNRDLTIECLSLRKLAGSGNPDVISREMMDI